MHPCSCCNRRTINPRNMKMMPMMMIGQREIFRTYCKIRRWSDEWTSLKSAELTSKAVQLAVAYDNALIVSEWKPSAFRYRPQQYLCKCLVNDTTRRMHPSSYVLCMGVSRGAACCRQSRCSLFLLCPDSGGGVVPSCARSVSVAVDWQTSDSGHQPWLLSVVASNSTRSSICHSSPVTAAATIRLRGAFRIDCKWNRVDNNGLNIIG